MKIIGKYKAVYNTIDWNNIIDKFIHMRKCDPTLTLDVFCKEHNVTKYYFLKTLKEKNIHISKAKTVHSLEWNEKIRMLTKGRILNPKGSNGKLKGKKWNSIQKNNLKIAKLNSIKFQSALKDPIKYEKSKNTLLQNYPIWRKHMEECGRWLPLSKLDDWQLYLYQVEIHTRHNNLSTLENYKKNNYQLDHIFSKKQGFIQNIDPKIIGNIVNLRYIPAFDNNSKNAKCHISKIKLLELYNKLK